MVCRFRSSPSYYSITEIKPIISSYLIHSFTPSSHALDPTTTILLSIILKINLFSHGIPLAQWITSRALAIWPMVRLPLPASSKRFLYYLYLLNHQQLYQSPISTPPHHHFITIASNYPHTTRYPLPPTTYSYDNSNPSQSLISPPPHLTHSQNLFGILTKHHYAS